MNSIRLRYFLGFITIILLLGLAEYLEVYKGMAPCPLCMLQRIILLFLGIVFLLGTLLKGIGQIFVGLLSLIVSISGILFAGRQVWLQHMPSHHLGECGVSLSYMFKVLPLMQVLKQIWIGGMECSQQGWVFMHLSLAEWSLVGFLLFFVLTLIQLKRTLDV